MPRSDWVDEKRAYKDTSGFTAKPFDGSDYGQKKPKKTNFDGYRAIYLAAKQFDLVHHFEATTGTKEDYNPSVEAIQHVMRNKNLSQEDVLCGIFIHEEQIRETKVTDARRSELKLIGAGKKRAAQYEQTLIEAAKMESAPDNSRQPD